MKSPAKRLIALIAVLTAAFAFSAATVLADGLGAAQRSRQEIRDYAAAHPAQGVQSYEEAPSHTAPYKAGRLSKQALEDAQNTLNQIRFIAGLDEAVFSDKTNQKAQQLSLIMAANDLATYSPACPAGMDSALYESGKSIVLGSNLTSGYANLHDAIIYGWMPETDPVSITKCAHRRWLLSPTLSDSGAGQVGLFAAMYLSGDKAPAKAVKGIAWPAQNMPEEYFSAEQPWTLSLGFDITKASITIKSDKNTWQLSGSAESPVNGTSGYFAIANTKHGETGCIIFQPKGINCRAGDSYDVTVNYSTAMTSSSISYNVSFFSLEEGEEQAVRIAGSNRILTAIDISKAGWSASKTAIVANGYSFPDALAGAPLSYAADCPILLTGGTAAESSLTNELIRLGVENVYILGGEAAVSSQVENVLKLGGMNTTRLAGSTRYETAVEIAKEIYFLTGSCPTVYFASADNFPDALAVSPVAAIRGCPILYIGTNKSLDKNTAQFLDYADCWQAVILGGTSAVSNEGEASISGAGLATERISGNDRYETALRICEKYNSLFTGSGIAIATGQSFPDALAGGAFAAREKLPMLLIAGSASADMKAYASMRTAGSDSVLYVFGGAAAVSDRAIDSFGGTT